MGLGVAMLLVLVFLLVAQPWKGTTTSNTNTTTGSTGGSSVSDTSQPQHITVQHILIGFNDAVGFQGNTPAKAQARTQEQARTLAYDLLNQIKGGANFDQLVTQYTDDSPPGIYSMSNTGVTPDQASGEFQREGMVAAFGNVGFSLQVGEVGIADYDPVNSPFGYHIIKRIR
jgi:PPIC-type PPIASE domain